MLTKIKELDHANYSFHLYNTVSSTLHMHDAYEIILVLRGTVDLKCTAFNYHLSAGDMFIINVKELHKFSNGSEDNLILTLYLNPYAYQHIFPKLDFYFFVCDSYTSERKDDPKLKSFQRMFLNFALSTMENSESNQESEEQLMSLISFMLGTYQSYSVIPQGYQSNTSLENRDYQTERIREIQGYLYRNSKNKITLDDLSEHLHLNKYYVSHLCKSVIGLSMTDFLSLIRVEQSELTLLTSNMSIEQIALEYGFSAKRYYEKHFSKWHGISPAEYRALFLNDTHDNTRRLPLTVLTEDEYRHILNEFINYTDMPDNAAEALVFTADFNSPTKPFDHFWENTITISDPYNCMHFITRNAFATAKKDIGFDTVKISNLFLTAESIAHANERITPLIDMLISSDVNVVVSTSFPNTNTESFLGNVADFFRYVKIRYGENPSKRWKLEVKSGGSAATKKSLETTKRLVDDLAAAIPGIEIVLTDPTESTVQYSHNSVKMLPHILNNCINKDTDEFMLYRELYDSESALTDSVNLYANNALLSSRLEKKPLYYLWHLMTFLGDEIISNEPGMIVTKQGSTYHILMYDFRTESIYSTENKAIVHQLNLLNVEKDYMVIKHYLDSDDCLFQQTSLLKFPQTLPLGMVDLINQSTAPEITFDHISHTTSQVTIKHKMNPNSVLLVTLAEQI